MAVQETVDITINSSQAIASLRNIENNLNLLTNGFKDFMGGVVEGMTSALRETTRASAGVDKMRKSFDNLGASAAKANVGKKISQQADEANKSITGLNSNVVGFGKRLLGLESIIGALAFTQLIRGAYQYAQANDSSSMSTMNAAAASASATKSFQNFQIALLNVLEPINKLIAATEISVAAFTSFLKVLISIGAVLLSVFALGKLVQLMNLLQKALTTTGAAAGTFLEGFKRIGLFFVGIGANIKQAYEGLKRFFGLMSYIPKIAGPIGKILTFAGVIVALGKVLLKLGLVIAALTGLMELARLANSVLKWDWLDSLINKWDTLLDKVTQYFRKLLTGETRAGAEVPGRFAMGPETEKNYEQALQRVANARLALTLQIDDATQAYKRQNEVVLQNLRLENRLFGASSDMIDVERLRLQFQQQRIQAMDEFARRMRDLTPDEAAGGGRAMILAQQEAYMKLSKAAEAAQITEIKGLQRKRAELEAFNKQMEYTTEMYNQQIQRTQTLASILQGVRGDTAGVLFEREQLGRGPVQQQIAAAYDSARRSALEAQRQFAETFGDADGLTPERMAELVAGLDAIAAAFKNLAFQTENNILISQQWSTGWKDAYETFVDNALNAADRAREVFNGMVSSMENALDNFVRTGKLNFRDLINSMIADLMSAALRQAFRNLLMATSGGGGGWLSSLGRFFAGFFANGGFIPPGKAGIVGERGPELVQGPAQVTPLGGMSAPINNYYTYNINALDAKSVAQLFSENRRTLLGVTEQARKEMPIRQRF